MSYNNEKENSQDSNNSNNKIDKHIKKQSSELKQNNQSSHNPQQSSGGTFLSIFGFDRRQSQQLADLDPSSRRNSTTPEPSQTNVDTIRNALDKSVKKVQKLKTEVTTLTHDLAKETAKNKQLTDQNTKLQAENDELQKQVKMYQQMEQVNVGLQMQNQNNNQNNDDVIRDQALQTLGGLTQKITTEFDNQQQAICKHNQSTKEITNFGRNLLDTMTKDCNALKMPGGLTVEMLKNRQAAFKSQGLPGLRTFYQEYPTFEELERKWHEKHDQFWAEYKKRLEQSNKSNNNKSNNKNISSNVSFEKNNKSNNKGSHHRHASSQDFVHSSTMSTKKTPQQIGNAVRTNITNQIIKNNNNRLPLLNNDSSALSVRNLQNQDSTHSLQSAKSNQSNVFDASKYSVKSNPVNPPNQHQQQPSPFHLGQHPQSTRETQHSTDQNQNTFSFNAPSTQLHRQLPQQTQQRKTSSKSNNNQSPTQQQLNTATTNNTFINITLDSNLFGNKQQQIPTLTKQQESVKIHDHMFNQNSSIYPRQLSQINENSSQSAVNNSDQIPTKSTN